MYTLVRSVWQQVDLCRYNKTPGRSRPGEMLVVELPGIEPGSFVTSPGLLRAQFAHGSLLGPPAQANMSG